MKRLTTKTMVAAAFVVLAAGSASAQTLKAEIPFAFRVGNAVMAPGAYHVNLSATGHERYLIFRNADTHASAIAQFQAVDVSKDWKASGNAAVRFECGGPNCSLRGMWTGFGETAYDFGSPKHKAEGDMRVAEIGLSAVKAD
jgi:hypothetical protein